MTPETKQHLLSAFDALNAIASGAPPKPSPHPHSHGGSAQCDVCGHSLASGTDHECPVGMAIRSLLTLVPVFEKRAEWLAEP